MCEITPSPPNVASIPQRSPFRYPGGKTWFVPIFRRWMGGLRTKPRILVEPFAGGGIISLTALFENLVEKVVMVELDDEVAAVWQAIVEGDSEWLAHKILSFEFTKEAVEEELWKSPGSTRERAFQAILRNRTLYSGILARGSGFPRYGEKGRGISSRWYPQTLAQRFLDLQRIAHRIEFRHGDGREALREFAHRDDTVYFIDPPYTHGGNRAGKRLYRHNDIDHGELFRLCRSLVGDFLMTYSDSEEIASLARYHELEVCTVPMRTAHRVVKRELVIAKDFTWAKV